MLIVFLYGLIGISGSLIGLLIFLLLSDSEIKKTITIPVSIALFTLFISISNALQPKIKELQNVIPHNSSSIRSNLCD